MPRVSVILPVYNSEEYVEKSIKSVLEQTYKDFELIIINDASTDGTAGVLKKYSVNRKIKILTNYKNLGITKSINRGIRASKGEYIARIDADDWWRKNLLSTQILVLKNNSTIGILGANFIKTNVHTKEKKYINLPETDDDIRNRLYKKTPFCHSNVIIRKKLFEQYGLYDKHYEVAQDYELWNRLLLHTKGYNTQKYLSYVRGFTFHSANKWRKQNYYGLKIGLKYCIKHRYSYKFVFVVAKRLLLLAIPTKIKQLRNQRTFLIM